MSTAKKNPYAKAKIAPAADSRGTLAAYKAKKAYQYGVSESNRVAILCPATASWVDGDINDLYHSGSTSVIAQEAIPGAIYRGEGSAWDADAESFRGITFFCAAVKKTDGPALVYTNRETIAAFLPLYQAGWRITGEVQSDAGSFRTRGGTAEIIPGADFGQIYAPLPAGVEIAPYDCGEEIAAAFPIETPNGFGDWQWLLIERAGERAIFMACESEHGDATRREAENIVRLYAGDSFMSAPLLGDTLPPAIAEKMAAAAAKEEKKAAKKAASMTLIAPPAAVLRETAKAVLFNVPAFGEIWFPLSQIEKRTDGWYASAWILREKGIDPLALAAASLPAVPAA